MSHHLDHISPHVTLIGAMLSLFAHVDPTGLASLAGPIVTLVGGILSAVSLFITHLKERRIDAKLRDLHDAERRAKGLPLDGRIVLPDDFMSDT